MPIISLHISKSVRSAVVTLAGVSAGYVLWKWLDDGEGKTPKRGKSKKLIPGLLNVGNSCFMNVLLQAFASCPSFVKWLENFLKDTDTDKDHVYLAKVVMKIMRILTGEEEIYDYYFDPSELLQDMHGRGWQISSQEQDAHEFYHAVMTTLIEEYRHHEEKKIRTLEFFEVDELLSRPRQRPNVPNKSTETEDAEQFSTRRHYPSFRGTLANVLQCQTCGYKHPIRYDGFDSLSVPLPSDLMWMAQISLVDCLRSFMAAELVNNVECVNCARIHFEDETPRPTGRNVPQESQPQVPDDISNVVKEERSNISHPDESTRESLPHCDARAATPSEKSSNVKDSDHSSTDVTANCDVLLGGESPAKEGNMKGEESGDINTGCDAPNEHLHTVSDVTSNDVTNPIKPSTCAKQEQPDVIKTDRNLAMPKEQLHVEKGSTNDVMMSEEPPISETQQMQSALINTVSDVIKANEQLNTDRDVTSDHVTCQNEPSLAVNSQYDESQSIVEDADSNAAVPEKTCDVDVTQDISDSSDARKLENYRRKLPFPTLSMTGQKDSFEKYFQRRHYCAEYRSERGLVYPPLKRSFQRCLSFGKLPDCLCMHIQRLVWKQGTPMKKMNYVRFPEILDVGPFTEISWVQGKDPKNRDSFSESLKNLTPLQMQKALIMRRAATSSGANPGLGVSKTPQLGLLGGSERKGGTKRIDSSQSKQALYKLMSVIVHVGDWSFSGHFLAYRRSPESVEHNDKSEWVFTSDSVVRKATREEVFSCPAYMLFYERIKS